MSVNLPPQSIDEADVGGHIPIFTFENLFISHEIIDLSRFVVIYKGSTALHPIA